MSYHPFGVYSWHGTQEHRWFSQGTFSNLILAIPIALALIPLRVSSNPGAGSCTYVLLDEF